MPRPTRATFKRRRLETKAVPVGGYLPTSARAHEKSAGCSHVALID